MDNVGSAAAAGDSFPTTRVLTADGVVSLVGCLMGNPFINAVYIGHPAWKAMGGRIGYSAATGIFVILLSWLGIVAVMTAPAVAILAILLHIGMLVPQIADWGEIQIDLALGVAGTSAAAPGSDKLEQSGLLYRGFEIRGRRDARRHRARRHAGVRRRAAIHEGLRLRAGGRRAHLLRLHPW